MTVQLDRHPDHDRSDDPVGIAVRPLPIRILAMLSNVDLADPTINMAYGALVTIVGRLDSTTAESVRRVLITTLEHHRAVACDVGEVDSMDREGLKALVDARQLADRISAHFWVLRAAPAAGVLLTQERSPKR